MQPAVPHRLFDRLALIIVVVGLAIPITYLEVAQPSWDSIRDHFQKPTTPTAAPKTATPTPKPTTTTPAPAAATVVAKTATTTTLVHVRAAKDVNSENILNLDPGTVVELRDDATATWQGVVVNGKNGYIYRDYLQYK
jgi:hypothetical protein